MSSFISILLKAMMGHAANAVIPGVASTGLRIAILEAMEMSVRSANIEVSIGRSWLHSAPHDEDLGVCHLSAQWSHRVLGI